MSQLTAEERDLIAEFRAQGATQAEIARRLNRSASTISRELRRNGDQQGYGAIAAQRRADERRRNRPYTKKAERERINPLVRRGLSQEFSPDQIAQRLKREYSQHPQRQVSASSIYRWIAQSPQREHWQARLRRRGKARRKPRQIAAKPGAAPIAQRPAVIENRGRLGDFEGDMVLGQPGTGGITTLVDRKSRCTFAFKTEDKRASTLKRRIQQEVHSLPKGKCRSLTFDNGTEFAQIPALGKRLGISVYFAEPGKPQQRGTNENTNRLLRQYFPKGIDFTTVSHQQVRQITERLNNRPRACLGYRTPHEVFYGVKDQVLCD
jgi:IS30 family transposase